MRKKNKQKVLHFVLTLDGNLRAKMLQNFLQSTWKTECEKSNNKNSRTQKKNIKTKKKKKKKKNWIAQPYFLIAIIEQM